MKAFLIISLLLVSVLFALPSTTLAGELDEGGPGKISNGNNKPAIEACGKPNNPQYAKCIAKSKPGHKCGKGTVYGKGCQPPQIP